MACKHYKVRQARSEQTAPTSASNWTKAEATANVNFVARGRQAFSGIRASMTSSRTNRPDKSVEKTLSTLRRHIAVMEARKHGLINLLDMDNAITIHCHFEHSEKSASRRT